MKTRLEAQEAETRKADSKFKFSLDENEKLKTDFNTEKAAWAKEKVALIKRAEKAKASLEEVTTNFTGLQQHINQMTFAIFGKIILHLRKFYFFYYEPPINSIRTPMQAPEAATLGKRHW